MVGEGVLLTCLEHPDVKQVLTVNRKHAGFRHPKLKELIIPDFIKMENVDDQLTGYDACFYCAGISSRGLNEAQYMHITYDTTLTFAPKVGETEPRNDLQSHLWQPH